jgi:hypothetical protein
MSDKTKAEIAAEKNRETAHQSAGSGKYESSTVEGNSDETRRVPDERLERLSEKNAEGHEKNMKAIEEAHKGNDGKPDPRLGREDNGNTPIINADGSRLGSARVSQARHDKRSSLDLAGLLFGAAPHLQTFGCTFGTFL